MGVKGRRRVYESGGSRVVTLFKNMVVAKEVTMAGNRLLIIDPSGKISEDILYDFLETEVEPAFNRFIKSKE